MGPPDAGWSRGGGETGLLLRQKGLWCAGLLTPGQEEEEKGMKKKTKYQLLVYLGRGQPQPMKSPFPHGLSTMAKGPVVVTGYWGGRGLFTPLLNPLPFPSYAAG